MSCVFGYTIGNDVSERTWQKADRGLWRAKNADTFKPMGPWIETDADLDKMETIIKVNGKETGRFHTNDMIFGVVPFLDGGNLYSGSMPKFTHFHYGTGLGVRYYTSFGPIRVDVGTPINREPGDSRVAVYVSLGQAF